MIDTHDDDPFLLRDAPRWYRWGMAAILWISIAECLGLIGCAVWWGVTA